MNNQYIFSEEDIKKCSEFADNVDTSFYVKRNQWDSNKRKSDSRIGKMGELVVYNLLKDKYSDISLPDFHIYKAKEKSWDYDLKSEKFNLHVKTQEKMQSNKFGESWIFQLEDKHIFKNYHSNDYVAFIIVDWIKKSGELKAILSVNKLHDLKLFKKPVLSKLYNKSAVYFADFNGFGLFELFDRI